MSHTTTTPCECPHSGWCERHQCRKTAHWHMLCRSHPGYFRLWEEKRGPGQNLTTTVNPAVEFPCARLGDDIREQECPTCQGSVRLKVFACELHGECTIGRSLAGVACCTHCEDYERTAAAPTAVVTD